MEQATLEEKVLNETTSFCQDECNNSDNCSEEACVLYRIEEIVTEESKRDQGLRSFKESVAFEEYKDSPLRGASWFKKEMKKKYNLKDVSDLYKKIINYQISKYGTNLVPGTEINFVKDVKSKSYKCRRHNVERSKVYSDLERLEKRAYKRDNFRV